MMPSTATRQLVVLYGIGGLSDVGRRAILAALEQPTVKKITVITEYPELLNESNLVALVSIQILPRNILTRSK